MSRANIYIRKENEEAWDKIENKSDWVNDRLAGVSVSGSVIAAQVPNGNEGVQISAEQQPATKGELTWQQPGIATSGKLAMCKEHGVPKEACKLMKHK